MKIEVRTEPKASIYVPPALSDAVERLNGYDCARLSGHVDERARLILERRAYGLSWAEIADEVELTPSYTRKLYRDAADTMLQHMSLSLSLAAAREKEARERAEANAESLRDRIKVMKAEHKAEVERLEQTVREVRRLADLKVTDDEPDPLSPSTP